MNVRTIAAAGIAIIMMASCKAPEVSEPTPAALTSSPAEGPKATASTPAPTPTEVPGLSDAASDHIELRAVEQGSVAGMAAYRLILSKGSGWAVKGPPASVAPKIISDKTYDRAKSALFLSGDYILYFPDNDLPKEFVFHVGRRPGMTVIDTDEYR